MAHDFATVPDPVAGERATGRIRYDRRPSDSDQPPLVLLGGTTQTVASWSAQLRPLAARREVIAYETRGQGQTDLDLTDCSPARHVEDFTALVQALGLRTPIDLCGFSFGGRIALAIAVAQPSLIRKLVISGVALERGAMGRTIVRGWRACLATGDLEALAWVSLPNILGEPYLSANAKHIESMVKTTVARNQYAGTKALIDQTLDLPPDSRWHPEKLAYHVSGPVLCIGGELDRIAPPDEVRALGEILGAEVEIFPRVGHTVPIEAAVAWRDRVERFLSGEC